LAIGLAGDSAIDPAIDLAGGSTIDSAIDLARRFPTAYASPPFDQADWTNRS
jgi:hypothetical protein